MSQPSTMDPVVRDALLEQVDSAPPLPYTSADLIRSGRRSLRLRRLAATSGALVVAAAVAVAVTPVLRLGTEPYVLPADAPLWTNLDPRPFCTAAAEPAAEPASPPRTVQNNRDSYPIVIPSEPTEHATARLSCHLLATVPDYLPGARFALHPAAPAGTVPLQVYPGREFDPDRPDETTPPLLAAGALVTDGGGTGSIGFGASPTVQPPQAAAADCEPPACTVRSGPQGEVITVLEVNSDVHLVNIWVYKGQTMVFGSAANGVPEPADAGGVVGRWAIGRDDLPISIDDLIEILLAPELTLFPEA